MIETYKARREKMAEFLRSIPQEAFDINIIANTCGSICCIAGWAANVFPETFKLEPRQGTDICDIQVIGSNVLWYGRIKYVEDFFGFYMPDENEYSPLMPEFYDTDDYQDSTGNYQVPIGVAIQAFLDFPYKED